MALNRFRQRNSSVDLGQKVLQDQSDTARKKIKYTTNALKQLSNIVVDSTDYRVGGKRAAKFTVPGATNAPANPNVSQAALAAIKTTAAEQGQENAEDTQFGAYNKKKIDMTDVANIVLENTKASYNESDFASGKATVKSYGELIGLGSVSRHAMIADIKTQLYTRNPLEYANVQNSINKWTTTYGSKATYRTLSMDTPHTRVIADFNRNQQLVDDYLKNHGINTRNLSINEINKMIGVSGKSTFGNTNTIYNGKVREKVNTKLDQYIPSLNTGWAGKSGKGGVKIDDEMREVLMEKRFQLQMQPKINQLQRANGGIKNTASAWVRQGTQDTDTMAGYRHAQGIVHGARAATLIAEGTTAGVGTTMLKSIEATGRLSSGTAKTVINLGGKVYAHGNTARAMKWTTKTQKVNTALNMVSNASEFIGKEGTAAIHRKLKASVEFTSKSTMQKAKIIGKKTGRVVGSKAKQAYTKNVAHTKVGKGLKAVTSVAENIGKATAAKFAAMQVAVYKHTKIIRAPFTAINKANRFMQVLLIKAALGFAALCVGVGVLIAPVAGLASILPSAHLQQEGYDITSEVGNAAITDMLAVQQAYLREVEAYWDANCTAIDPETEEKLHPSHSAYFALYMGDNTDYFENLTRAGDYNSTTCNLSTNANTTYGIDALYKTIISMATVATGNEDQDKNFYSNYCCMLLNKILHRSTWNEDDGGIIPVYIYDTGLTDGMRLDPLDMSCSSCGSYMPKADNAWMHSNGRDSNEYSEWLRSDQNYNEWKGWTNEEEGYFDWAQSLWELDNTDWKEMDIELPGAAGGAGITGGSGAPVNPSTVVSTIEGLEEAGYSAYRVATIQIALNECGKHVYGAGGPGLPYRLDCSDFVSGCLLAACVPGAQDATTGGMVNLYQHTDELIPGTVMVRNDSSGYIGSDGKVHSSNHVVLYVGAVEGYGDYCVVECSTKARYKNSQRGEYVDGVAISGFNSISDLMTKYPYRYYLNPYGD